MHALESASFSPAGTSRPGDSRPDLPRDLPRGECLVHRLCLEKRPREWRTDVFQETDSSDNRAGTGVDFKPGGKNLEVLVDGKLLTDYLTDEPTKPYYYPVIGPTGAAFTRAYPDEGRRRRGPATTPTSGRSGSPTARSTASTSGRPTRSTSPSRSTARSGDRRGRPSSRAPSSACSGRPTTGSAPTARRSARTSASSAFYGTEDARVIDFDITLKATDGPVTFGDTKEGMFGLRVASSMDVNSEEGRQDHQRRGADRRRRLGQGVALGRLHRAGRGQDGRRSPS